MEKKASRTTAKSTAKPKASVRKMTVRDLEPKKGTEVKGMTASYTITMRTR